jgi:DNA repair protein RecO (recombination protein O)
MPAPVKAEAIVLRSMRFGEADRILHLYTPGRGRMGAIAKGVRRTKSRFGGRLEPFSHVALILHEGRGDLATVTGVDTVAAHAGLRDDPGALDSASRACDAVARMFDSNEGHPEVFNLLANELTLLEREPARATLANQLAFRLKLMLAAGFAPQLSACAACGESDEVVGYSAAAGGVVCGTCEASSFALDEETHTFMVGALGRPLNETPPASERALRQADRAISETVEYHAHLRLRAAAGG